jgi:hypothetical protein
MEDYMCDDVVWYDHICPSGLYLDPDPWLWNEGGGDQYYTQVKLIRRRHHDEIVGRRDRLISPVVHGFLLVPIGLPSISRLR